MLSKTARLNDADFVGEIFVVLRFDFAQRIGDSRLDVAPSGKACASRWQRDFDVSDISANNFVRFPTQLRREEGGRLSKTTDDCGADALPILRVGAVGLDVLFDCVNLRRGEHAGVDQALPNLLPWETAANGSGHDLIVE